jgi:hypothetical protein
MSVCNSTRPIAIAGTPLEIALDDQRTQLFLAHAMVDTVSSALEQEFGEDWPAKYPEFPRVLREVSRIINDVAGNLEAGPLEDRAHAIARAESSGEVSRG